MPLSGETAMRFPTFTRLAAGIALTACSVPALLAQVTPSAVFVAVDTATQGTWKGVYGSDGAAIYSDVTSYPAYAQVAFAGQVSYVWASSTTDVRALQKYAASDRIAPVWYTGSSFTIDLNLTDTAAHQSSNRPRWSSCRSVGTSRSAQRQSPY